jgi:thiol-disulfide isomerase/thioredoxin
MKNLKAIMAVSTIGAVFVAAVLFGQNKQGATETSPSSKLAPAPPWQLQDVDGKTVRSSDFKGKVVILDFWATWCGPCRMELPGFVELQKKSLSSG